MNYTVGQFSKKTGVSIRTLQDWDKSGKLKSYRSPSNRRFYSQEQLLEILNQKRYIKDGTDLDSVVGKTVLITGGTGSLGNALTQRICDVAKKVIIYSRNELLQANMRDKFREKKNIRYIIGDIRNKDSLIRVLDGVDICIHAACYKRVEVCSYNAIDAIDVNILGSINVLEACRINRVPKTLFVSTDKSCAPCTLYGGTKFVSEQLFINGNNYTKRDSVFTITRYGNVFGSNGSIKILFERQLKEKGIISITHPEMTRFFMTLDQAVDLNLYALNNAIGGEIFIPKLKAIAILDFAKILFPTAKIEFIGLRGPEKIHEELIAETEIKYTVDCGKYYKIIPSDVSMPELGWDAFYPKEKIIVPFKYTSDKVERLTEKELLEMENQNRN